MATEKAHSVPQLEVFFDGDCPICRMEVSWYGKMDKAHSILWRDITVLDDSEIPQDKTRDDLLGKFHVRDPYGQWFIGVDAFARIWRNLPILRHGAFMFSLPLIRQITEIAYRAFLRWQSRQRKRRAQYNQ